MQADARQIKHYRSKMTKAIAESIKEKFEDALAQDQDPTLFLENLSWMYQDLIRIEEDVVPCFPTEYQIYSLFVREYHKTLNGTLKKIVADDPEASLLLALNAWVKEYKKNMKELGVPPELLEPPLLEGKEQSLIDDYLGVIVKKLDEWSANLMRTEILQFMQRADPPDVDADGQYGLQGAVILFQMVNQQCDLAIESGQGAILARVVTNVNRVMKEIQGRWSTVVDQEFAKHTEKPEEVPAGLVEYLIALANDQIKSADYSQALSDRLEPLVSAKYSTAIGEQLDDAIDGYLDVAKKCTQTLIDSVFNDLKPATKKLFQPEWYDGIMRQIVETMRDYMADYQAYLNPSLLDVLIEDLVDAFLVTYINALANAPKLRMPAATDRIKEDVSVTFSFFTTLKPAKEVEAYFEVIEMILAMLEASKSLVFLSYWQFAKVHGPNLQFVEGLMRVRGDLDRSAVNEIMESIKRKVKDEGLTERELFCSSPCRCSLTNGLRSCRTYNHEEDRAAVRVLPLLACRILIRVYADSALILYFYEPLCIHSLSERKLRDHVSTKPLVSRESAITVCVSHRPSTVMSKERANIGYGCPPKNWETGEKHRELMRADYKPRRRSRIAGWRALARSSKNYRDESNYWDDEDYSDGYDSAYYSEYSDCTDDDPIPESSESSDSEHSEEDEDESDRSVSPRVGFHSSGQDSGEDAVEGSGVMEEAARSDSEVSDRSGLSYPLMNVMKELGIQPPVLKRLRVGSAYIILQPREQSSIPKRRDGLVSLPLDVLAMVSCVNLVSSLSPMPYQRSRSCLRCKYMICFNLLRLLVRSVRYSATCLLRRY
jgi:hypothetical protein